MVEESPDLMEERKKYIYAMKATHTEVVNLSERDKEQGSSLPLRNTARTASDMGYGQGDLR
jgi:hypothetical protein